MLRVKQVILTILTTVSCYGQTFHVSGTYQDQRHNSLPGPRVRYLLDDGPAHSAFTDADGHFVLTLDDIRSHNDILTPGRYVGATEIEDDGVPFEEKMAELSARLNEQFAESHKLGATIKRNLEMLGSGE